MTMKVKKKKNERWLARKPLGFGLDLQNIIAACSSIEKEKEHGNEAERVHGLRDTRQHRNQALEKGRATHQPS